MKTISILIVAAASVGCGGHKGAPPLDAAHLPAELHGLLPGVADEAAATAALTGAELTKDKRLGGTVKVELNGEPAIAIVRDATQDQAWLVKLDDGPPRVAMVDAKVTDGCKSALATIGDHAIAGTCSATNRKFDKDEHELCATTPDGKHDIQIECVERSGELSMWVKVGDSGSRSTMINRN